MPTPLNIAIVTLEWPPHHITSSPPKSTTTAATSGPETTSFVSWGFPGSLITTTILSKSRAVALTSISTPAKPSPRTPASGPNLLHQDNPESPSGGSSTH
ncbi:hypothetical protein Moror_4295 [Moniliophthora roreri MCA 2997]|uniref:Uncharacterized protein n=2 Tax=Moniliophthora roreri TaxID=221103 RepID=V2YFS0_MONRO|nr:hypothetical protein Moror_4295 [Moniliophthora roreri MCA 2997]